MMVQQAACTPNVSIIVPTYNERENLPLLACLVERHLRPAGVSYELIVVDDSSPDGTAAAMDQLAQAWPDLPVRVLSRPGKLGLGTAYLHGLGAARAELVCLMVPTSLIIPSEHT